MKKFGFDKLREMQEAVSRQVSIDGFSGEIRYLAGFDIAYFGDKCVCAAVVFDAKTLEIVEKKHIVSKVPMNYVPGLLAFRAGPPICQVYYDLEYDPDVLFVDGHGIAHPSNAGVASFVGVELNKPCIGVARNLLVGELVGDDVLYEGNVVGRRISTKEHANPLFVSPGHLISVEQACELVRKCVVPPHKMPEPIHAAHRYAKKMVEENNKE